MAPQTHAQTNPLLDDRDVSFQLHRVHHVSELCKLPFFQEHSEETFELFLQAAKRFARTELFPAYRAMDQEPPSYADGSVSVHPRFRALYPTLAELGLFAANRPAAVGGQQLPLAVSTLAGMYLAAANMGVCGLTGLITGAAHLLESFGSPELQARFMDKLYAGTWTGTMCLTEPHAGSSLADVSTSAVPTEEGYYLLRGAKIFISGGSHDLTPNIVHMVLARIEGAPSGTKGLSLFAVPRLREGTDGTLEDNDVACTGAIHKVGWRALPSVSLQFGERNDCRAWLVGAPNRGMAQMFQMMNEARILVGAGATSTASVAYQQGLLYARERLQGRALTSRELDSPPVPIVQHLDVRRMLLRQKAIVEGSLSLVLQACMLADQAVHSATPEERHRAQRLLDLLTPITKTFPAEKGFEANALALQLHGGYGYSTEYLPEAWLRDQKLNSIHEGTTTIHGLDLLGRKAVAGGGEALGFFVEALQQTLSRARASGLPEAWCEALDQGAQQLVALTSELGSRGLQGALEGMLGHSHDYLEFVSVLVLAWQWLLQAAAAQEVLGVVVEPEKDFLQGKIQAAQYWFETEMPLLAVYAKRCLDGHDAYIHMQPAWF